MGVKFKAGHIVPRWCGIKVDDRKAQHWIKFGVDVEVCIKDGITKIYPLSDGCVIEVPFSITRKMNNGTKKISGFKATVWIDCSRVFDSTAIRCHSDWQWNCNGDGGE